MVLFLKILVFTVFVPGIVAGYIPWSMLRDVPLVSALWVYPAVFCFAAGTTIYVWCAVDFGVAGQGTPAPIDAPKHLVVRGLYQNVRNPMYVGVVTVLAGWTLLYQSENLLKYTVAVFGAFHLFVVFYEEPQLQRLFGEEYSAYLSKVGRWIPRINAKDRS